MLLKPNKKSDKNTLANISQASKGQTDRQFSQVDKYPQNQQNRPQSHLNFSIQNQLSRSQPRTPKTPSYQQSHNKKLINFLNRIAKQKNQKNQENHDQSNPSIQEQQFFTEQQMQIHLNYIEKLWDYRYWRLVDTAIQKSDKNSISISSKQKISSDRNNPKNFYWFKLFAFLNEFQQKCLQIVKKIIHDGFVQPQVQYTDHRKFFMKEQEDGIYLIDGIVIRIAHITKLPFKNKQNNMNLDQSTISFFYQDKSLKSKATGFDTIGVKSLHQEFLAYNIINNLLISLAVEDPDFPKVRVPLTCLVKYIGYTALCQADSPCDGLQTLVHGPTVTLYQHRQQVVQILQVIGSNLNLKPFNVISKDKRIVQIPFSITTELHRINSPFRNDEVVNWISQSSYLYPPNQQGNKYHKSQYYLMNIAKLWPLFIDSDISKASGFLRPQIVLSWKRPLSNVAFLAQGAQKDQNSQVELAEACKALKEDNTKAVAKMLDEAKFFLIDSTTVEELFHQYGINMNMLGLMAEIVTLAFNKKILEIEMMVRILKKIFFTNIEGLKDKFDIKEMFVDFLNLIFVKNEDSKKFHEDLLYPQIQKYYEYTMKQYPPNVPGGGLLHAITYHFGIRVKIIDYPFYQNFGKENIFNITHVIQIIGSSKTFTLDTCPIKKMCQDYKKRKKIIKPLNESSSQDEIFNINQCISSLKVLTNINRLSTTEKTYTVGSLPQAFFYAELSQLYLVLKDQENTLKYADLALKLIPQKHADSIKPFRTLIKLYSLKKQLHKCLQYYQKSLSTIGYHLSPNHPLCISVHNTLGNEFVKNQQLDKCQKIFAKSFQVCQQSLGYRHKSSSEILLQLSQLPLAPQKVLHSLLQALTILENLDNRNQQKIQKVCMKISQIYLKMGNIPKSMIFAKRSDHWRVEIIAFQKVNDVKKVLALCDRVPLDNQELVFLIRKAFESYLKLLDTVPLSNLYKLFVTLKDYIPSFSQSEDKLFFKLKSDKLMDPTIIDLIKNVFSYLINEIPSLLIKPQFYGDIFSTIEVKDRRRKLMIEQYMQILAIVGVEKAQQLFIAQKKTY